mmetsp:Transcript_62626/g.135978  ORF Transcript_62626/g.135978 Transcript_62626/m.135978 type:complete len:240 (+) Transcript_62626:1213-1932(+)
MKCFDDGVESGDDHSLHQRREPPTPSVCNVAAEQFLLQLEEMLHAALHLHLAHPGLALRVLGALGCKRHPWFHSRETSGVLQARGSLIPEMFRGCVFSAAMGKCRLPWLRRGTRSTPAAQSGHVDHLPASVCLLCHEVVFDVLDQGGALAATIEADLCIDAVNATEHAFDLSDLVHVPDMSVAQGIHCLLLRAKLHVRRRRRRPPGTSSPLHSSGGLHCQGRGESLLSRKVTWQEAQFC